MGKVIKVMGKAIVEVPIYETIYVEDDFFELSEEEQNEIIDSTVNWEQALTYGEVTEFDVEFEEGEE